MVSTQQYRTNRGPVPMHMVPQQIRHAPGVNAATPSGYPHGYRNNEGPAGARRQNFDNFVTGPGRAHGPPGQLYEYPIPTPGQPHHFRYEQRPARAQQVERRLHPNERANTMGPAHARALNDVGQTRAVVRTTNHGGWRQNVVVGVMDHPPGNMRGFQRAPIEPINRQGRQEATRHLDNQLSRIRSYPPRGIDAERAGNVERNYQRERRPAHPHYRP